ncbi:MAG: endonuclease/exonuclease/phosphatase family protein [Steroidobacteraceae bacterium]|jgi:endonuclease/exonuclease/phosphatase family metal-dependent hydrolase|nr:endonuclease/exonuclease/phosphatase family protein [Steroidobacteraceae bacterium]
MRLFLVCLAALSVVACHAPSSRGAEGGSRAGGALRIATWNLEWLVAPEDFLALARSCVPEGASPGRRRRTIPCDVAAKLERSTADFDALARYARELDADVVALQEVDGPAAARRVFPGYRFCFSTAPAVQNLGFAVRDGLPFRCGRELADLSLGGRLRSGVELVLHPGTAAELRLLSVHLKSGCGRRTLDSPRDACGVLARQVPVLERWIDAQAAAGRPFAVLGDFNRELLRDAGPARNGSGGLRSLWSEIDDADPPEADLANAAEGERFVNCHPGQNFNGYIDHIVLSRGLAARRVPGSFRRVTFEPREALRRNLTDHCPVAVDLATHAGRDD